MQSNEIRQTFLNFFKDKGHDIVPSSSLLPHNDKTLLFTNAGMVQFKDVFLGIDKRPYQRATTSQRCVRAGGKHNDLENVGYTARHHTFFEMLGNFSFGDYFKHDAIHYAWELLTEQFKLPKDKLWITVYEEDDEAYDIWANDIGVPAERIARIGAKDNFWQMGDTGPCGPCSEIFYDHGEAVFGGPPGTPDEDGDRYIEIWNLVFMQYDRQADGTLLPLPKPSVDTGMGLERIAAVLQQVHSNYQIDLFQNLITAAAKLVGCDDLKHNSLKVIVDHIRSVAFMLVDGVVPSNEGRGYVLRRIMRRAIRHGYKLGQKQVFFHQLVAPLITEMGGAYPELAQKQTAIEAAILDEEKRFAKTLDDGMQLLETDLANLANLQHDTISGETLFKLYDTYGFPVDLTADIARERNLIVDLEGYEALMDKQRQQAKRSQSFAGHTVIKTENRTHFMGYSELEGQAIIEAILVDSHSVRTVSEGQQAILLLDKSPFYGESGGQVGDTGLISTGSGQFQVHDTQKQGQTILHMGQMVSGDLSILEPVNARVDDDLRAAIRRHHSATHLLHAALRTILGNSVEQKGSLVSAERLRFDFSFARALSDDELQAVSDWVNREILANHPVATDIMSPEAAAQKGAMALFGEKYGEQVRVLSMGNQSIELCGGTHVHATGDIGAFTIISQSGVAAGVRRIEAVAGWVALAHFADKEAQLNRLLGILKSKAEHAEAKLNGLLESQKTLQAQIKQLKTSSFAGGGGDEMQMHCQTLSGYQVLAMPVEGYASGDLRELADRLRDKYRLDLVVLACEEEGKAKLVATVGLAARDKLHAGKIVNQLAELLDGKGGGRPDFAQAGGNSPEKIASALTQLPQFLN